MQEFSVVGSDFKAVPELRKLRPGLPDQQVLWGGGGLLKDTEEYNWWFACCRFLLFAKEWYRASEPKMNCTKKRAAFSSAVDQVAKACFRSSTSTVRLASGSGVGLEAALQPRLAGFCLWREESPWVPIRDLLMNTAPHSVSHFHCSPACAAADVKPERWYYLEDFPNPSRTAQNFDLRRRRRQHFCIY